MITCAAVPAYTITSLSPHRHAAQRDLAGPLVYEHRPRTTENVRVMAAVTSSRPARGAWMSADSVLGTSQWAQRTGRLVEHGPTMFLPLFDGLRGDCSLAAVSDRFGLATSCPQAHHQWDARFE